MFPRPPISTRTAPLLPTTTLLRSGLARDVRAGDLLLACIARHGSAAHAYPAAAALLGGTEAWRNLADAVHFLCTLHGRLPGVVDHAAERCVDPDRKGKRLKPRHKCAYRMPASACTKKYRQKN